MNTGKQMDHNEYPKRMKKLTGDQLRYTIQDAREAMLAMPDGENAGYYADEISYAAMELSRRARRIEQNFSSFRKVGK